MHDLCANCESVGEGQDFENGRVLVAICSLTSTDQSRLSMLGLHAGKSSVWRTKEVERIGPKSLNPLAF